MKRISLALITILLTTIISAQITVNVNTPGEFSVSLSSAGGDANTVTNLTITGKIDARDIKFMRDNMPLLALLDIEGVQIDAFNGTSGTKSGSVFYRANEMPEYSFCNSETYIAKTSLTNIKLPSSILSIGRCAFYDCRNLTGSLIIPNSVTSIGNAAFSNCKRFTGSLVIPNSITSIEELAFKGCSGFNSLSLPASATKIGFRAFFGCTGFIGTLNIPGSITFIGSEAFADCVGFSGNIYIPNSVTVIESGAFAGCSNITSITTNEDNNNFSVIEGILFNKNETKLIQCPAGIILNSYVVPNSVDSIGFRAFSNCKNITGSLTLTESINDIGSAAFLDCTGFTGNLTIPNSVTTIGWSVFSGCSGFNGNLTLPNSITSIPYATFRGCSGLTGNLIIPNTVTYIDIFAFSGCNSFTGNLLIPNSVTQIGQGAFFICSGFTGGLTIPNSVKSIGSGAFSGCSGLTGNLTIPNSVKLIGTQAFYNCSGFSELNLPSSAPSIADQVFYNCTGLKKIIIGKPTPEVINQYSFYNVDKTICELVVPVNSKTNYQTTEYWKDFININEAIFVFFDSQGGSADSDTIVDYNTTVVAPSAPSLAEANFEGWYKEAECVNAWDFDNDLVTTNTTLYAKWYLWPTSIYVPNDINLNVYPNPANDYVKISGVRLQAVNIYNISGIVQKQFITKNENNLTLDINNLRPGYYFVEVLSIDGKRNVLKLVKK